MDVFLKEQTGQTSPQILNLTELEMKFGIKIF